MNYKILKPFCASSMCANVLLYERVRGRGGNSEHYKPRDTNVMHAICKQPIDARNWGCLLYMYIEGKSS